MNIESGTKSTCDPSWELLSQIEAFLNHLLRIYCSQLNIQSLTSIVVSLNYFSGNLQHDALVIIEDDFSTF